MNNILMTTKGEKILRKKLEFLKNKKRPKIISLISNARSFGDLRENSEYHAAKEEQIICEKKIKEIEYKLINAKIIDISKNKKNKIIFGSKIKILNIKNKKKYIYKIVGDDESNIKKKLISINSPLIKGLIGKKKNDIVKINLPNKKVKYKVLKIK